MAERIGEVFTDARSAVEAGFLTKAGRSMHGGACAGAAAGGKVGKPMAGRIFLMVAAVLASAMNLTH